MLLSMQGSGKDLSTEPIPTLPADAPEDSVCIDFSSGSFLVESSAGIFQIVSA